MITLTAQDNSEVINMSTPYVITPMAVPGDKVLMHQLAAVLKYSSKPTMRISGGYRLCREGRRYANSH